MFNKTGYRKLALCYIALLSISMFNGKFKLIFKKHGQITDMYTIIKGYIYII